MGISNFSMKLHVSNIAQMTLNCSSTVEMSMTLNSQSDNTYKSLSLSLNAAVENNLAGSCTCYCY